MDKFSIGYIAGFFDGEGSIGIYRGGGSASGRTLRCQVTQTVTPESTALLAAWRERWGGSLAVFNKALRRSAYNWQTSGTTAATFLSEIRPWLILKAEQADVALQWQAAKPPRRRGPDGRILPMLPATAEMHRRAERALAALKVGESTDVVIEDAVRHTLRQIVNVKGD